MKQIECAYCGEKSNDMQQCYLCGEFFCAECGTSITPRMMMCNVCLDSVMAEADALTGYGDHEPAWEFN